MQAASSVAKILMFVSTLLFVACGESAGTEDGLGTAGTTGVIAGIGGIAGTLATAGISGAGIGGAGIGGAGIGGAGVGAAGDGFAGSVGGVAGDGAAGDGSAGAAGGGAGTGAGPDPTAAALEVDGPYGTTSYDAPANAAYTSAKIYHPTNGTPPYDLVALIPGYTELQASVDWWAPRLASHGFVVIAIETKTTNDCPPLRADQLWAGLDTLSAENTRSGSALMGKLDTSKKAVMGHSMGGGASLIAAAAHAELKASIPFTPWSGGFAPCTGGSTGPTTFNTITVPTLVIAGLNDAIAPENTHAYPFFTSIASGTPKAYMEFTAGGHNAANNGNTNIAMNSKYAVAWLKLYMDGDERYRTFIEGAEHDKDVAAMKFSQFEP